MRTEGDLADYLRDAETLRASAALGAPSAALRFVESFPKRSPTAQERTSEGQWSLQAARLIIARENQALSWGALEARVLTSVSEPIKRFVELVFAGDAKGLSELFARQLDLVRPHIDAPLFHFDCPAVVQQKNHRAILEVLLEAGADINARSDWWAGGFGVLDDVDEAQARWLMDHGAQVDLGVAAGLGWTSKIEAMLASDPDLVHRPFGDGKRALHYARTVETAALLLERGAEIDARCIDHGSTAAEHLIVAGTEVPRFLIARGASCNVFLAAALGDVHLVARALKEDPAAATRRIGRDPYVAVSDDWGGTILQWTLGFDATPHDIAKQRGHHEAYRVLMKNSDEVTRLLTGCWCEDDDVLERLDLSCDVMGIVAGLADEDRELLPIAAWNGRLGTVRRFLDLGLDPHVPGPEDSTAIDRASFRGWAEVVELLLERDSDPPLSRRNRFGGTPLSACIHGAKAFVSPGSDHLRTARALVDAGAPVDATWLPTGVDGMDEILAAGLDRAS